MISALYHWALGFIIHPWNSAKLTNLLFDIEFNVLVEEDTDLNSDGNTTTKEDRTQKLHMMDNGKDGALLLEKELHEGFELSELLEILRDIARNSKPRLFASVCRGDIAHEVKHTRKRKVKMKLDAFLIAAICKNETNMESPACIVEVENPCKKFVDCIRICVVAEQSRNKKPQIMYVRVDIQINIYCLFEPILRKPCYNIFVHIFFKINEKIHKKDDTNIMGYNINENVSKFFHISEMESLKKKIRQLCKEKWDIEKGEHTPVPVFMMRHVCKDELLLSDRAVGLFKNEQNEDETGLFEEDGSDRKEQELNASLPIHRDYFVNGHLHKKLNLDFALHRYFTFREEIDHTKKLNLAQSGFFYVNDDKSIQCHYCFLLLPFLHFDGCELNHDKANEGNASALCESKNREKCHLMEGENVLDVPILNPSNYIFESHRLYSFLSANWLNAFVSAFDLAKHGFYFTGDEDSCRCMFCKLEVRGWELGDTAEGEHRRWNPHCPFLQPGNQTGNVPIGLELSFSSHDSLSNPFVPTPITKYGPHLKLCKNTKQNVLIEALGITPIGDMKYRQYRTLQSREHSFKSWPKQISQTPDVLCAAGFFYTGSGDRVICFQCGGGLKDWHPDDSPWIEHSKWFSSCPYLNIKKGKKFIDHIIRTNKEQESLATDRTAIEFPVRGSLQCWVCKSQASNYVNLPCGHITSCVNCVAKETTCRACEGKILAYIEVFL